MNGPLPALLRTRRLLEAIGALAFVFYPLVTWPLEGRWPVLATLGSQLVYIFVFAILALGLNVVLGDTGLLHLAIGAFFGIGAYTTAILTIREYPFQWGFVLAVVSSIAAAAAAGVLLGAPTLRLRGDYLALVTLGFGEVVRVSLRNFVEITGGTRGLNPIPAPSLLGFGGGWPWSSEYRLFYYLVLGLLALVVWMLLNLERSRLGRALVAIREDELAAACMGINPARVKLTAFAMGAALAGLAGSLFAHVLTITADPENYGFNQSMLVLCCVILGGLGSIRGTLLGVTLLIGFDRVLSPAIDRELQGALVGSDLEGRAWLSFSYWRFMIFGLALILMMRFRPEGLWPSSRVKREMHEE